MTSESAGTHDQTPAERQAALDGRRSPEGYDVAPLEQALKVARDAIASLEIGVLGWSTPAHDEAPTWPIKDEVLARIEAALRPRQGTAPAVGGEELTQPPLVFGYTNWRGEYAVRKVIPLKVWYGGTEWHPEPQWLLKALDAEKGNAERDFAIQDMSWSTPRRPHSRCAVSSPPSVPQKGAGPGAMRLPDLTFGPGTEGWHDISTAPKDGEHVLVLLPAYGDPRYDEHVVTIASFGAGKWFEVRGGDPAEAIHAPTHWRPLPAAPSKSSVTG